MTSPAMAKAKGQTLPLSGQIVDMVEPGRLPQPNLLPTPNTMDMLPARDPSKIDRSKGGYANVRETVVNELLPTPVTTDYKQGDNDAGWNRHTPQLGTQGYDLDWGKFAPAIERWEKVIGRPAPAPTKPDGKDGAHRLSSEFTEWMMGLPAGWITGVGLSRNEELKACGNGVVPQQAEMALRILLKDAQGAV